MVIRKKGVGKMGLFDYVTGLFKSKPKAYTSPWHEFTKYDHYKLGQMHGQTRYPEDYLTRFPHNPAGKAYESGIGSSASPAFAYSPGGGYAPSSFNMPSFEPPPVPMLSLDEMMDIINRRVGLMIDPQIEGLRRGIEEERGAHERRVGETKEGYQEARGQLVKMGQQAQREGASSMVKRGIYDSGMAMDLANRIQRQTAEHGLKLENEQARILADLAEYLATRERHTTEQIEGLEGRRGEWVQSLLDEMQRQERDRQDRLEQQAFENWLSQTAMEQQIWQANQAAAAAASRGSAPSGPNYNDILNQMKLAAIMSLPAQQRQKYLLQGAGAFAQPSFDDWLNQQRMSNVGQLSKDQLMRYLFGLGYYWNE
jgi:hypothetical protein